MTEVAPRARKKASASTVTSFEAAARLICDQGDDLRVVAAMYPAQPNELLAAVAAETVRRDHRLTVMAADLTGRFAFVADEELRAGNIRVVTIGGRVPRRLGPHGDSVPTSLWEIARRFTAGQLPVDVFVGLVAEPDPSGHHSFGPMVSYAPAALEAASFVALQVNSEIPRLPGYPGPARTDVDLVVEPGPRPLVEFRRPEVTGQHELIGAKLASLIPDGATVQLGIGGIPEGFVRSLAGKHDLGIHSGAIPEGAIDLIEGGAVTGAEKGVDRGVHVTTSLLGGRRLYEYAADPAHKIEMRPVTETHDPAVLARQSRFFAVNSAFEVDLTGQVNAEAVDGRRASSGGGQVDFGKWAHANPDGGNIIALPARAGDGRARVVARLSDPYVVTTHRSDVDYVVSEFGVADLRGRTAEERARALIEIAHPDDRAGLEAVI